MEFLVIFAFAFVMIIPLVLIFSEQTGDIMDRLRSAQVRRIGSVIADKAESVYYLGEPSKATIRGVLPSGIVDISIAGRALVFTIVNSEGVSQQMVFTSLVNMTGNMSSSSGVHNIVISATDQGVEIQG